MDFRSVEGRRLPSPSLLFLALALACGGEAEAAEPAAAWRATRAARPNIVFILADDLGHHLMRYAPGIQARLGDGGLTFRNAFVTVPLCSPSRVSILTGQYAHNHNVYTNVPYEHYLAQGHLGRTVPNWLRAAGYRTGLVGKYVNNYPEGAGDTHIPPGWDEWQALLLDRPAGFFDYVVNENGRLVPYGSNVSDYQTDVLARKAVEFIDDSSRDPRPFFLYLAFSAPHLPANPAPRHEGALGNLRAPRTASFNEEDISDKPRWMQQQVPRLTASNIERLDRRYTRRAHSMLALDEAVQDVVSALERRGLLENSYVFFTSDNGYMMGQHRFPETKDALYEESIRVPLIVRGPGVPAGAASDGIALNIDLAPTFAELAGIEPLVPVDGRSLLPLLSGAPGAGWRGDFLVAHGRSGGIPAYAAVHTLEHVYAEYDTDEIETELYDLRRDPEQLDAIDPHTRGALVRRLSARLFELAECRAESCR